MYEVRRYVLDDGTDVIGNWLAKLRDRRAAAKIVGRFGRLNVGNFGDCKPIRGGVWELRINWGPGFRVYYALAGKKCVLLLCGGDKRTQQSDIEQAMEYWADFQQRGKR